MAVKKKFASKAKAKAKKSKPVARKIPRQNFLPGMEDAKIAAIENLALDYAELRDERQALSAQEVDLKQKLMKKMHDLGKTTYKRNGIEVKLTVEKEGVKVRVKEEAPSVEEPDVPEETAPAPVEGAEVAEG